MAVFAGDLHRPEGRFALVAGRFNSIVVQQLVDGAFDGLKRHGVAESDIDLVYVPGALEIPIVARRLAESGNYAAVLCLGAVIRGATSHFDIVAGESAAGMARCALETGIPVINAVLTTETVEQAM